MRKKSIILLLFLFVLTQKTYSQENSNLRDIIKETARKHEARGLSKGVTETTYMTAGEYTSQQLTQGMSAENVKKAVYSPEERRLDNAIRTQMQEGISLNEDISGKQNDIEMFDYRIIKVILVVLGYPLLIGVIIFYGFLYKKREKYFRGIKALLNNIKVEKTKFISKLENQDASIQSPQTYDSLIKSILIGIITAILIGFIFSDTTYFYHNEECSLDSYMNSGYKDNYVVKEVFNYKLAFISSALVVGFMVFVYHNKNRRQFLLGRIGFLLTEKKFKRVSSVEENIFENNSSNSNDDSLINLKGIKNELIHVVKKDILGGLINFNTRISRGLYFLSLCVINFLCYLTFAVGDTPITIKIIFFIIALFFLIKIYILRLHDMNYSGWNSLFCLIPFFILFLSMGSLVLNLEFINNLMLVLSIPSYICIVLFHLALLFIPGTKGNNHYGSN